MWLRFTSIAVDNCSCHNTRIIRVCATNSDGLAKKVNVPITISSIGAGLNFYSVIVIGIVDSRLDIIKIRTSLIIDSDYPALTGNRHYDKAHKSNNRNSHFHKLRDNARLVLLNTRLTLRALAPWPHRPIAGPDAEAAITVWHPLRSIRALLTERATPRELAFAVSLGIFLGAVPLIACHTLAILVAAALLRLNRVAAVAASQLCMPPVVPALCIEMGHFMRYGRFLTLQSVHSLRDASFLELGYMGLEGLLDWFVGSLVVGTVLAVILGFFTYAAARVLQRVRNAF